MIQKRGRRERTGGIECGNKDLQGLRLEDGMIPRNRHWSVYVAEVSWDSASPEPLGAWSGTSSFLHVINIPGQKRGVIRGCKVPHVDADQGGIWQVRFENVPSGGERLTNTEHMLGACACACACAWACASTAS